MKNKTLIFFLCVVVIVSCSRDKQTANKIKTVHLSETKDFLPISSFVESVDYIQLSFENKNTVIGNIQDIKLLDNEIIVKQQIARESSFLRFSNSGKFLNKIGVNGKGPSEIQNPRDIVLFKDGYAVWDQLAVHSISKSGDYKRKIFDAHLAGNNFLYIPNNFFLFHELTSPGILSQYSEKGNLVKIFNSNEFDYAGMAYSKIEQLDQNKFHLFSPIIDTVFSFNGSKLLPAYIFDGGSRPTFMQLMVKNEGKDPVEMRKFFNNNKHVVITKYLENANFLLVSYMIGSSFYSQLIRKKNWEIIQYRKCYNDIDGGLWEEPFYLSEDDFLYIPLYPYQIQSHKIANKYNKDFNLLQDKTIQNNSPVIMRCKLK